MCTYTPNLYEHKIWSLLSNSTCLVTICYCYILTIIRDFLVSCECEPNSIMNLQIFISINCADGDICSFILVIRGDLQNHIGTMYVFCR
jgi:hypothetical protein